MPEFKTNLIDIASKSIYPVKICFGEKIESIIPINETVQGYTLPGFIDAHVHIESSMLVPAEFARLAVVHGTVGTVSDPHEIGNVMGISGVKYMIENGKKVNFKFNFGAPSCVPATVFETAGAEINVQEIEELLAMEDIKYLAEMMNWPGVLHKDPMVVAKIEAAKRQGKPIDGHAPGLKGEDAAKYASTGITTDHECTELEEALDKIAAGMKIIIREGSAAKNFDALFPLIDRYPGQVMFCSDDKHPDYLVKSHINELVKRALAKGADLYHTLMAACIEPVQHYNLDIGLLRVGDPADFIRIDHPSSFNIQQTYINGLLVAEHNKSLIPRVNSVSINQFNAAPINPNDLKLTLEGDQMQVIMAYDGQLLTGAEWADISLIDNPSQCALEHDILKLVVYNRYHHSKPAIAYIKNFGLKCGAMASTVAHDSHNIIAMGTSDEEIANAINLLITAKGGVSATCGNAMHLLPLPVAGLMSTEDGYQIAARYEAIDTFTKNELGSTLTSPFMTLSFMALLVIPSKKLSDKGLFDGLNFEFSNVFKNYG